MCHLSFFFARHGHNLTSMGRGTHAKGLKPIIFAPDTPWIYCKGCILLSLCCLVISLLWRLALFLPSISTKIRTFALLYALEC